MHRNPEVVGIVSSSKGTSDYVLNEYLHALSL
jgi:hypothetical protein